MADFISQYQNRVLTIPLASSVPFFLHKDQDFCPHDLLFHNIKADVMKGTLALVWTAFENSGLSFLNQFSISKLYQFALLCLGSFNSPRLCLKYRLAKKQFWTDCFFFVCIRGGSKAINDMEKEDNCSPVEQEMVAISTYLSSTGSIRTLFSLQQILSFWLNSSLFFFRKVLFVHGCWIVLSSGSQRWTPIPLKSFGKLATMQGIVGKH